MNTQAEPSLAPPGAGLPAPELLVGRLLFAWRCRTGNRDAFTADFQAEREKIHRLIEGLEDKSATRRVLIKRPRGLEDSSRFWSVWMTLEHLRIVHGGITRTIGALARGVVPPGKASTAAVKPDPQVTAAVVSAYEKSCDDLLAAVAAVDNLHTEKRFAHPWFGPLDAAGWHALSGRHLQIHRLQIERILQGLAAAS